MKKKVYHVNLNEPETEALRIWLKQQGVTFSAYLQFIIREAVVTAKKIESEGMTPIMTASGLLKAASRLAEDMEFEANEARKAGRNAKKRTKK